jgi:cell division protease FtsH
MGKGGQGGALSFGKAGPKLVDQQQKDPTSFQDVAGVDEAKAELREVVDFLKSPDRYRALGARMPKGVLLVGPPGTGKTLLARAVAGEAGVPFFSISGSEFIEMFVGVGAARMRDLFAKAKERAPCIIFIDEIDSIGKSRGGIGAMGTHDEREQTLNQLLAELDGFEPNSGVVLMAATNRPEVLDPALLRAGRFDRRIAVERPDLAGREAILKVHAVKVKLDTDVDLGVVARRTPGAAGADLANIVNEAALAAVRRSSATVDEEDFEEAIDRITLGLKKAGGLLSEDDRRRVAIHESGHALVALTVDHADPVHRVSIVPRTIGALGFTLQLSEEERAIMTESELVDRITVLLGGREAENLVTSEVSTGAANDLERATQLAREMVTRYGMSEKLGLARLGQDVGARYLGVGMDERDYSEHTQREVDAEVRRLLEDSRARAEAILHERRADLDRLTTELLDKEDLAREEIDELLGMPLREVKAGGSEDADESDEGEGAA